MAVTPVCLVITADDLGYSATRDDGILCCFRGGHITRASLLVNGASAQNACQRAKQQNMIIGLHLNLTEGSAVAENVQSLVVEENTTAGKAIQVFRGKMGFRNALSSGEIDLKEVRSEIVAQVEEFLRLSGSLPPYIDGHQHVHVLPGICDVLAEVMTEFSITETRMPVEDLSRCHWVEEDRLNFYREVSSQAIDSKSVWDSHGIRYSSGFLGMTTMGKDMTEERVKDQLTSILHCLQSEMKTKISHDTLEQAAYESETKKKKTHDTLQQTADKCETENTLCQLGNAEYAGIPKMCDVGSFEEKDAFSIEKKYALCIEWMVHPGYPCTKEEKAGCSELGPDDFALSSARQHEINVLSSAGVKQTISTVCKLVRQRR